MNDKIWESIDNQFKENGIRLNSFKDGEQFQNVLVSFIDNEIKRVDAKGKEESSKTYAFFADSTYYRTVEPDFMPMLIEYSLITEEQSDSIDSKIDEWKAKVEPGVFDDIYIYAGVLIVIIALAVLFLRTRKKRKTA